MFIADYFFLCQGCILEFVILQGKAALQWDFMFFLPTEDLLLGENKAEIH